MECLLSNMENILKDQVKTALSNTGARWAVFLIKIESGWEISSFYKRNKTQQKVLNAFLSETKYRKWLKDENAAYSLCCNAICRTCGRRRLPAATCAYSTNNDSLANAYANPVSSSTAT